MLPDMLIRYYLRRRGLDGQETNLPASAKYVIAREND